MPTTDCELIAGGFLGQTVNSLTTIAFLAAGILVVRRPRLRWVGIALLATGLGSFLFHGPMPPMSQWGHDVSLGWLILALAGLGRPWERWTHLPGLAVVGILTYFFPAAADPLAVILVAVAVLVHLTHHRSAQTFTFMVILGVLAGFGRLGATGGPLCDPGSWFQPHGMWHIGAAMVVAWFTIRLEPELF